MYLGPVPFEQIPARDGALFAKQYGDRIIPATSDSVFAERTTYNQFVADGLTAFAAEAANLRAKSKSEAWIQVWLNAASGAFVQRVKTLHILSRPQQT